MIHLAATTSPIDLAWAAFDVSMLRLHDLYGTVDQRSDTPADRAHRMALAIETNRLWDDWRKLFLGNEAGEAA
jgi:hypothetical protein